MIKDLRIRRAESSDAEVLETLAKDQQITEESLAKSPGELSDDGFVTWGQSSETYVERCQLSEHFLVAERSNRIVAWVMAYSLGVLSELQDGMSYEDKIVSFFLKRYPLHAVFIDQICVIPSMKRTGVATAFS